MKKDFIHGYFLIIAAIVGPIVTWFLTSNNYETKIEYVKQETVDKTTLEAEYIAKEKYTDLQDKEKNLLHNNSLFQKKIDSLEKELFYLQTKYSKLSEIPNPKVKFETDEALYEIEKAYQSGKFIILDIRITNLGNDKENYGLNHYKTSVLTDDGMEYKIEKILKGGNRSYFAKSDLFNNEETMFSLYFGNVSSQLHYNSISFRSSTTNKTAILERIQLSKK